MRKPTAATPRIDEVPAELLEKLRDDYLSDCREKVDVVRQQAKLLATRNGFKTAFPILLYVTHQLKGSGGSFGFQEISDAARTLHTRLSEQLDEGEVHTELPDLAREVAALADALESSIEHAAGGMEN